MLLIKVEKSTEELKEMKASTKIGIGLSIAAVASVSVAVNRF